MRVLLLVFTLIFPILADAASSRSEVNRIKADQAKARDLLKQVIAYETEVGRGQVPAMARYLADEFAAAGFAQADIHILPLGETASLVVRYQGTGRGGKPIALLAHMDVVTAKPEDWRRDPYVLVEEGGFFFGRGSYDNKAGVAALAAAFIQLRRSGFVPSRDLVIVFTGDEETEGACARDLLQNHRDLVDAEFALNSDAGGGSYDEGGKPLVYGLQTAEKTYASFELTVRNPGGHSSLPRVDNAIYELGDALMKLRSYRFPAMWNDTTLASFKAAGEVTPGELGEAMRRYAANPRDTEAADYLGGIASEVGRTRTTCIPTLLRGGHADNALPQSATVTVNCRIFPGVAVANVQKTLQDVVGNNVEVKGIGEPTASDASPLRPDVLAAVTRAVHARHPRVPVVPVQESGATDGLYFRAAGIPTYGVSGLFIKDSDSFAHGLDERIPVASYQDEVGHWLDLLQDIAGQ